MSLLKKRTPFFLIFFLLLSSYFFAVTTSLIPCDYFIHPNLYRKNPNFHEVKTFHSRFICSVQDVELFAPYTKDFTFIESSIEEIYRQNKYREVSTVRLHNKKYLLKKQKVANFYIWLKQLPFRSSIAYRSWHYGHVLNKQGIRTPKPLILFEKRWGPFWGSQYILYEYIHQAQPLVQYFKHSTHEKTTLVLDQIHQQLNLLNQENLIHFDYGCRNILFSNNQVFLIDLDDLHHYKKKNFIFDYFFRKNHQKRFTKELTDISPSMLSFYQLCENIPER